MFTRKLRVALVGGEPYSPLYERLAEFTSTNGILVEAAYQRPLPELIDHLRRSLSDYDLVCTDSRYVAELHPGLLPLEEVLPSEEIAPFPSALLARCRWQGRLRALPRAAEPQLLYFRTDLFEDRRERRWYAEASGGGELRVPGTWEELALAAQYFTRDGSSWGFAFPGQGEGLLALFAEILAAAGGTLFDAEGRPRFFTRAGEWALSLLRDLYRRWEAAPPDTPQNGPAEVTQLFRSGRCALACGLPADGRLTADPGFSAVAAWHSVALLPGGPAGTPASWTTCPAFAIPSACSDPEAALELLRFFTSVESQLSEARRGAVPSREDALREALEELREGTLAHRRLLIAAESLRSPLPAPPQPAYDPMVADVSQILQQAITGERDVVEALNAGYRGCSGVRVFGC